MTEKPKPTFSLAHSSEIERWILALKDTRSRTRSVLTGLTDDVIDAVAPSGGSSIGAILYHLAIIEADWLLDDILGTQETDWPSELFPKDAREDGTHLTPFTGETLEQHTARLDAVRKLLFETISVMSPEDLHRPRERLQYDVTPAWVLHHLMQHEAEHRSQIGAVREALGIAQSW